MGDGDLAGERSREPLRGPGESVKKGGRREGGGRKEEGRREEGGREEEVSGEHALL